MVILQFLFLDFSYSTYTYSSIPHLKNGLNSGITLMNLEYLRQQEWNSKLLVIFEEMQSYLAFCDQVCIYVLVFIKPTLSFLLGVPDILMDVKPFIFELTGILNTDNYWSRAIFTVSEDEY